jgi:hypothetical protein
MPAQVRDELVAAGSADLLGRLVRTDQDQHGHAGEPQGPFQRRRNGGHQPMQPIDGPHPVLGQVAAVRQQQRQRGHQIGGRRHGQEVPAQPSRVRDDHRVTGVGLGLAGEPARHRVHRPTRHVDDRVAGHREHRPQQRRLATDQIDRPAHLHTAGDPVDQFADPGLVIGHPHRPHHPSGVVDRRRVMVVLAGIDSYPQLRHILSLL